MHHHLKQSSCPHCKITGTLILHGYLYGYDLKQYNKRIVKGHRIFCSNRNRKNGCGKTFSIFKANRFKRFIIQSSDFWLFLRNIARGMNTFQSFLSLNISMSTTSVYRLYKRIYLNQHKIRRLLLKRCSMPKNIKYNNPLIKTITHIQLAFKSFSDCIEGFQSTFQTSFL